MCLFIFAAVALAARESQPSVHGTFRISNQGFSYTLTKLPGSVRVKRSFFGLFSKGNSTDETDTPAEETDAEEEEEGKSKKTVLSVAAGVLVVVKLLAAAIALASGQGGM